MQYSPKICICGGGNIAHSLAAMFSNDGTTVRIYTRNPQLWGSSMIYKKGTSHLLHKSSGTLLASNDIGIIHDCDCIVIALPRFAIKDVLIQLDSTLHTGQTVIFIPATSGMETIVEKLAIKGIDTLGFQRVPYVARTISYGHSVWISDVRNEHKIAFSRNEIVGKWRQFFEAKFGGHVIELSSFLSFTFSNSNPLLHPSRLVELLHGGNDGQYKECPLFYADWTNKSSEYYVESDAEMFNCYFTYNKNSALSDYESVLNHYEVSSVNELTKKIRSIESLKKIYSPWKKTEYGLWTPDFSSRYFTEDIPFGTRIIQNYARKVGVATPTIDYLINEINSAMFKNC